MRIPKVYGKSRDGDCPFCGMQTTSKNPQGIAVCKYHTEKTIDDIKCLCGSWLEAKSGKFGSYFNCINCGNMNYAKAMKIKEMSTPITSTSVEKAISRPVSRPISKPKPKEITISSRDVDYFD